MGREDTQVEEEQRHLQQRDLAEVEELEHVEPEAERSDVVGLERPNVSSLAVARGAVDVHGARRHAAQEDEDDEEVVEAKVGVGDEKFRGQAHGGDDA